jgi:hypothetical protein
MLPFEVATNSHPAGPWLPPPSRTDFCARRAKSVPAASTSSTVSEER